MSWRDVEATKGVYDFSKADQYMVPVLKRGLKALIVITDGNPHYDDGHTPHSKDGIAALAAYVSAIYDHYTLEKVLIEIGNEVNSDEFVSGPFLRDKPAFLAESARTVRAHLSTTQTDAKIICGGMNTIAMGFLRKFFRRGGLQACDAISVHPYRDNPDTIVMELDRLKALMREYGGEKPIYVTEFGKWFDDPLEAPDYMLKMVAQFAAAGVQEAYWYALVDEPWWPNMGLLEKDGKTAKPAAEAFRLLQTRLLPLAQTVERRVSPTVRLYEFGKGGNAFVVWGSTGKLRVSGQAEYVDARGQPVAPVVELSDRPVVILGAGLEVSIEIAYPVADTKYQYNQLPWSYFALRPGIGLTPLEIIDWEWASYRGAPDLAPLRVGDNWITTARFQGKPYHAVERFTANKAGKYRIEGWWQASKKTEASRLIVRLNRDTIYEVAEISPTGHSVNGLMVKLGVGDTLDFEMAPTGPDGAGSVSRRIKVHGPLPNE
ncbi:glycosyl hydrolase [Rhodobacteraceae bacterium D3-12]|nr:glycosyl hydrolase [Rhodobacteraceae bacterium D3-12]